MTTSIINSKALKSQIKIDLGLSVMVRMFGNSASVWMYPSDRNAQNVKSIEYWFSCENIKRVTVNGVSNPICVNGGEYNNLTVVL